MLSKLTIVGLSQYSEGHLWDNLRFPEGIDSDVFINEVIKRGGEFSLIYPDLDYMKYQIGAWSAKWAKTFERWITADNFEYEALFNLDVTTSRTETGSNSESGSKTTSGTTSGTSSGSDSETTSNNTIGSGGNTHSKAAYDSGTFQPTDKDESNSSVSIAGTKSNTTSGTTSGSTSGSETSSGSSNHTILISETRRGNQGITMSQELLDAERNVWMWNIYSHMADLFINEYCICIYN